MSERPLEGRVAAVTGASSGIGEATALMLAQAGCAVALGARRKDRLDALAERIEAAGGRAIAIECDVADEASAHAFVARSVEELGRLDIVINNAGVMLLGPIEGTNTDEWRQMVEVNVLGLLYVTQAAIPHLREGGNGHFVNISSVAGRSATAGAGVYNATKWGVTGFSEALRQEVAHSKIRVTCIEPGFVATELQSHNKNPVIVQVLDKMMDDIGEVLEAEDIASAILHAVTAPPRVNVNEVLIRPSGQAR